MRLPINHALPPLLLIAALAGCGGGDGPKAGPLPVGGMPANGPAADYPMVIGAPFQVETTTYTPEDKLNYDAVGYAAVGSEGGDTVSAAHKTLPLPSYVEVTSLDSGRTVLVRVERRGPMSNDQLIELSPGAAAQLGVAGSARPAVRVRRVNPPEQERALLRAGQQAPARMDTPMGLLDALNRKLTPGAPLMPMPHAAPTAAPKPGPVPRPGSKPRPVPPPRPVVTPLTEPEASAAPEPAAPVHGALVVQVAAFSTRERADGVAAKLNAHASPAGKLWRVRLGPFATRGAAEAALAKARAAGYSDARIQRAD